jgi:hypothetical protein
MNLSKHFKISLGIIALVAIGLFVGYRYVLHRIAGISQTAKAVSPCPSVLPKADKERITFNEKTHILTVQTAKGMVKEYAKNPVVDIHKDGGASISRHLTGFENEPFIGFGYSDTGRIFLGDNVFHFSRFDLVGAISWTPVASAVSFKVYTGIGYNFYHNTSVNLALNPAMVVTKTPDIAGFISVRF